MAYSSHHLQLAFLSIQNCLFEMCSCGPYGHFLLIAGHFGFLQLSLQKTIINTHIYNSFSTWIDDVVCSKSLLQEEEVSGAKVPETPG
jgi:hypothetical protein